MSNVNMGENGNQIPQPPTEQAPMRPHRGTTILVLGILGLVTMGTVCGGIILGIIAWIMGRKDLRAMDRGVMNPEGRGTTQAGTICGIIAIPLSVFSITILMAILFPVFMQAKEKAQQVSCLSNEKNLCLAMLMFADDHNDTLPQASRWMEDISPYMKETHELKCANDKSNAKSSFAMNAALSGKKLGEIADPANTVLLYETSAPGDSPSGGAEDVALPGRHNKGNNFAFADGHCKWQKQTPEFGP